MIQRFTLEGVCCHFSALSHLKPWFAHEAVFKVWTQPSHNQLPFPLTESIWSEHFQLSFSEQWPYSWMNPLWVQSVFVLGWILCWSSSVLSHRPGRADGYCLVRVVCVLWCILFGVSTFALVCDELSCLWYPWLTEMVIQQNEQRCAVRSLLTRQAFTFLRVCFWDDYFLTCSVRGHVTYIIFWKVKDCRIPRIRYNRKYTMCSVQSLH